MILTNKLKGVINSLVTLNVSGASSMQILAKEAEQNTLIELIIKVRNQYLKLDDEFNTEIKEQINKSKQRITCLSWLKT
jgi:hypothetical protein